MFLKLDFSKAYDKVAHLFLWDTLIAMGFSVGVIKVIKGLMVGAKSKIHLNGFFSEEIDLNNGVRHVFPMASPMAPLLYALYTQPLMELL